MDVPKTLSQEEVQEFLENGFVIVRDLMTSGELAELSADLVKLARGGYPCEYLPPLPAEITDQEAMQRILCIHHPHFISPVIMKYVKHPKVCGVLSQIVGAHLPGWDGSVKCMQSMIFVKPLGFQGQAWHQDEIYIPTRDRSLCGTWIAIDDATIENGSLWVIPGSHRSGYLYPQRPHDNPDEFDQAEESYQFDPTGEVPVELEAGSVLFFHGYLLHRSRKNRSEIFRRALVNHYMNAWSLLPWYDLPQDQGGQRVAVADDRAIVLVAGTDPYEWKGYHDRPDKIRLRRCKAITAVSA